MDTLYFAVETPKIKKEKNENIRILHLSGRGDFYYKGVRELLLAAEKITKKYDKVDFLIRAKIPEKWKKRFAKYENIQFIEGLIPKNKIFEEFYFKGDIFCSASYTESFGYPFLEAMAAGLPCIGNNSFAIPEIIHNNKTGFLINSPISEFDNKTYQRIQPVINYKKIQETNLTPVVNQLTEKLSILIENKKLRNNMGREGRKIIETGPFSIKERNKKLKKIYEEAIK